MRLYFAASGIKICLLTIELPAGGVRVSVCRAVPVYTDRICVNLTSHGSFAATTACAVHILLIYRASVTLHSSDHFDLPVPGGGVTLRY